MPPSNHAAAVAAWQQKLDKSFPHGAIMTWEDDQSGHTVPWIEVQDVRGLMPVIFAADLGGSRSLGPWRVASYEPFQRFPHLLARVTFDGDRRGMVWCAAVSATMAHHIDQWRAAEGVR